MSSDQCAECFYCRMPLAGFHEHDHAPVPVRHGGEEVVPVCLNCHNLKDRLPLRRWPADLVFQAFEECGPMGRIFLAKTFGIAQDIGAVEIAPLANTG